ncbi:MAG: cyclic nucleotide-binding domain-containing protein [Treponema sp.]
MKKILAASADEKIIKTVTEAAKNYADTFCAEAARDTESAANLISFEFPEIKVLDYTSSSIDCTKLIATIHNDAWLHYGGIIAVCRDAKQVHEIEELKDTNMLSILKKSDFEQHFPRLLRILYQNQQFLYTRGFQDGISGRESGGFICGNDPMDLRFYTNFLVSYLYNTNRISDDGRYSLQMTLMELLTNAVEHGNLGITFEEKSKCMEEGGDMLGMIARRAADPKYKDRKVHISYLIRNKMSAFRIKDDGDGFDWKSHIDSDAGTDMHGRGIFMSAGSVKKLAYNEKGNEVTFAIANLRNATNTIPGIMKPFDTIEYKDKQVICRENDMSNDLFFIVEGMFAVYVNGKLATVLTPSDMFIGEMAFLLNDRRTATVVAVGKCRLIKVPKNAFLLLIRKNPNYGIFLSKMLAQRLATQTQYALSVQDKFAELERD